MGGVDPNTNTSVSGLTNIEAIVGRVRGASPDWDVLVVDDNSPDGTGEVADKVAHGDPHVHVLQAGHAGRDLG